MALQAQVESLDDVPEGLHDFYEERDGTYRLSVEGVEFPDEVKGLKTALERERESRTKAEKRARELAEKIPEGFDPERWERLTTEEQEREQRKAEEKGEWEKLRAQLQEKHSERENELKGRLESLQVQLDDTIVDSQLLQAAAEHEAYAKLLPEHARKHIEVQEVDGRRVAVVVDGSGERMLDDDGNDMTIAGLVAWMSEQEEYWPLFKGKGVAGGGAAGRNGAGRAHRKSLKDMSEKERMDLIDEMEPEEYAKLVEAELRSS